MQQKQIEKTQQGSMHHHFAIKVDLANLKFNVDKLDVDKLEKFPTNLKNLKSKVDKLDVDKYYLFLLI